MPVKTCTGHGAADKNAETPPESEQLITLPIHKGFEEKLLRNEGDAGAAEPAKRHTPARQQIALVVVLGEFGPQGIARDFVERHRQAQDDQPKGQSEIKRAL